VKIAKNSDHNIGPWTGETFLSVKESAKKTFPFSILSSSPNRIDVKPTVPMPTVSVA
jgi:hypothetical protein